MTATVAGVRVIRVASWVVTFVAIGAAVAAWLTPRIEMDAAVAGDVALDALASAGIDAATVVGTPTEGVHHDDVPVWIVTLDVAGDEIEMRVGDDMGQLVYVDDLVGEDGTERALTEDEWSDVEVYEHDHQGRWIVRNVVASVAAAAIVGVGFVIARRSVTIG